jgi:hypothetical protein
VSNPSAPARYEIHLQGRLDERWAPWFDGLTVEPGAAGVTVLRGQVADQAALHGLLARLRDLGVPLISVGPDPVAPTHAGPEPTTSTGGPMSTGTTKALPAPPPVLSLTRLYAMRAGYLLMGLGLALVKWPLLPDVDTMPLYEGVTLCLLTAMSVLAFLGLRYPIKLLPLLLFESLWKVLWLTLVALPKAADGHLDAATSDTAVRSSLVVLIIAVVPWTYVWRTYVRAPGDRWR